MSWCISWTLLKFASMFGPTLALSHYFSVCRSRNSPVGHSNFIHGSTQIRHVGVNWFKSRSFYVLNWRVEKFDDWAGPNFPFSPQLVNLGRLDWSYYGIRTPGRLVTDSRSFRWYLGLLYAEVQLADLHSSYELQGDSGGMLPGKFLILPSLKCNFLLSLDQNWLIGENF